MVRTGSKVNPIANLLCNCHIALIFDVSGAFSAYLIVCFSARVYFNPMRVVIMFDCILSVA